MTLSRILMPSPEDYVVTSQADLTDWLSSPTHLEDLIPLPIPTKIRMDEETAPELSSFNEVDASVHDVSIKTELIARDASSLSSVWWLRLVGRYLC